MAGIGGVADTRGTLNVELMKDVEQSKYQVRNLYQKESHNH